VVTLNRFVKEDKATLVRIVKVMITIFKVTLKVKLTLVTPSCEWWMP
jgi:uncharacterized membrane protein YwzB